MRSKRDLIKQEGERWNTTDCSTSKHWNGFPWEAGNVFIQGQEKVLGAGGWRESNSVLQLE